MKILPRLVLTVLLASAAAAIAADRMPPLPHDDRQLVENVRRMVCYPRLEQGESVSITITRYKDATTTRVTYTDPNGRMSFGALRE